MLAKKYAEIKNVNNIRTNFKQLLRNAGLSEQNIFVNKYGNSTTLKFSFIQNAGNSNPDYYFLREIAVDAVKGLNVKVKVNVCNDYGTDVLFNIANAEQAHDDIEDSIEELEKKVDAAFAKHTIRCTNKSIMLYKNSVVLQFALHDSYVDTVCAELHNTGTAYKICRRSFERGRGTKAYYTYLNVPFYF